MNMRNVGAINNRLRFCKCVCDNRCGEPSSIFLRDTSMEWPHVAKLDSRFWGSTSVLFRCLKKAARPLYYILQSDSIGFVKSSTLITQVLWFQLKGHRAHFEFMFCAADVLSTDSNRKYKQGCVAAFSDIRNVSWYFGRRWGSARIARNTHRSWHRQIDHHS